MEWQPLLLSFEIAAVATVLVAFLGIAIGFALSRPNVPLRDLLDAILTAPMVLPPTVLGYYVLVALGRRSALGGIIESLTGSPLVFTRAGAVVAATLGGLPLAIKASRAALEAIDPQLVDAARTLGATRFRAFLTIDLPLARAGIASGLMLAFARSLGDFGVTLMVAGDIPGQTRTASLAIYDAIQDNRDNQALGMVLVLTALAIVILYTATKLTRSPAR